MARTESKEVDAIKVEVVFALADDQSLKTLRLHSGATVRDAIALSGLCDSYPGFDLAALPVGIWGQRVTANRRLQDGDRVEIYRELIMDPREARRRLANSGQAMRPKGG